MWRDREGGREVPVSALGESNTDPARALAWLMYVWALDLLPHRRDAIANAE